VNWLKANGRDPAMAKAIEFTNVRQFESELDRMPNLVLHELAHAYHNRVLPQGFANPDIKAAYEQARASGNYEQVERRSSHTKPGTLERAYALSDPMEYFAESSEAFFGRNDFFPFTQDELRTHDPAMFTLLARLWGVAEISTGGAESGAATTRSAGLEADSPVTFPKQGALPAKYPPDVAVQNEPAEKDYYLFSSPCRSLDQIRMIQKEMPTSRFTPPPADWKHLQRTRRILTEGGDLRMLALGDSIINDTMRSGWVALLREAFPKANIEATVYVRGGGGCQHYREEDRVAKYILPRKPDLVIIGGISQRDMESIREVVRQVRAGLPEVEILLATGAFGAVDARDPAALAQASHSGTGAYGQALKSLAAEQRCAYLDLTSPWAEYLRSAKVHPHRFYRDPVHANEYGEQVLAKIMMAFWTAPGDVESAGRIVFPNDESVLDLKRDFGAKGDGETDDTAALQAAIEASCNRGRAGGTAVLFIPNGTYRVTSNLVVRSAVGPWVYGESREGVVIRLMDGAPANVTSVLRTHPSDTQASSADFFMRNFRHLTIDVGRNPQVDGIRWYGNNSSILKDVRVTGMGRVGINAGFLGQNGPSLVQDALVEGSFETGVRCAWSWGQTLSRVTVRNARSEGVSVNATAVGIEELVVENSPVALRNEYPNDWTWWGGVVALVGGRFSGGDPAQPAITNRSVLYARDLTSRGFQQVLQSTTPGGSVAGTGLDEYLSHPAKKLFADALETSLNLPIKREPHVAWETNPANWVCANDHGAKFGDNQDDTAALQAAIDAAAAAGKTVVYLRGIGGGDPNWYNLEGEVRVHGSVRFIIALGFSRVLGGEKGRFIVDDHSAPVVKFLHLQAFGGRPPIVENRSRTNTLVVESCDLKVLGTGGGDIFVTDCPSGLELRSPGQSLWARQLNPEGDSDTGLVQNHGGRLWALGVKHEGRGVRFLTDSGGQTEILGLFNYAPDVATNDFRPAFDIRDAAFSAAGVRELSFGKTYPVKVREQRGEDLRTEQGGGWIGWALYRGGTTGTADRLTPGSSDGHGAARSLPRLKVNENRRLLVSADGRPFFWLGDTAWELFHRLDRAEAEIYLRDRAAKGFNVIQAVALAELNGLTEPNRYGHLPLLGQNPAQPAVKDGPTNDYWDFMDEVLDLAEANGLYVGLLPTWGKYVTSSPFDGKVDGIFNETNALSHGRFLGERYRHRSNLIWILGGDKAPSTPEAVAIWRAMARGIAIGVTGREDYDAVLMTYHTSGPGHVSDFLHNEPWLDFTSAQSSHGDLVESWRFIEKHWNRQPIKPVIDLESSYPGALIPAAWLPANMRAAHPSTKPSNDDHARRAAYWAVFAGAFGHTYGHNSIWQMYAPPRKPILDAKLTWQQALDAPSAKQVGYLRRLLESHPMLDRVPDQSLFVDGAGEGAAHRRATRGRGYALIYSPDGAPFTIRLGVVAGTRVLAAWFNPRSGETTSIGDIENRGERRFTPPESGEGRDWVLALTNQPKP
jgi:lysophospholipase L1-like esterase